MIYFDTSFLVRLVLPEPTSGRIAAFVRQIDLEQLSVSHWTRVEFSSLIAREVRMGGLDVQAAARADAQFETMVAASFNVLLPTAAGAAGLKRSASHLRITASPTPDAPRPRPAAHTHGLRRP